jgi:hypothetical protein
MALNRMVVPVVLLVGVLSFGAGVAAGVGAMLVASLRDQKDPPRVGFEIHGMPTAPSEPPPPPVKDRLVALVTRLDQATRKPLSLSAEQRSKLREQLQGLDATANLSDEEAQKRLDAIREIVKGNEEALNAAGGGGRGGAGPAIAPPVSNPFVMPPNRDHLEALRKHLDEGV